MRAVLSRSVGGYIYHMTHTARNFVGKPCGKKVPYGGRTRQVIGQISAYGPAKKMRKKRGNAAVNAFSLRHENSKTQLSYGKMHIDWVISILCARSVLFDLGPNILTSSPLTKSISTYYGEVYGTPPVQSQSAHCLSHSTDALNLLSPNIHMQILQTDIHFL